MIDRPLPREIVPILSGGGTRVACHLGVLQALGELGIGYQHVVGVSGGSIVAALVAAGWSQQRMLDLTMQTDFRQFRGFSLLSLLRTGGLSSGDAFEAWVDQQLEGQTFADLALNLHVLATDINGGGPVLFNRERTPDMKVSRAVRFSMSIPLMFSFKSHEGHIMTDGVILAEDALHRDWTGAGVPAVCFRLRSQGRRRRLRLNRWLPLATYVSLLVQTFMNAVSREYVDARFWRHTVVINSGEVSPVDFALSPAQQQMLLEVGYRTTLEVLSQKLSQAFPEPRPD